MSTALVLLLIHADYRQVVYLPENSPILAGDYSDFNVNWYESVGATIALSTFLNVVATVSMLGMPCLNTCKRCCDRKCSCDERKTSKVIQSEYEALYTGSRFMLENVYSQIIAITFIILLFSAAMPFFYLAGLLMCACLFTASKIGFLRCFKTPPRFGPELADRARRILEWAVLLHLLFGVYMLTNPRIFVPTSEASWYDFYTDTVGEWMHVTLGAKKNRFRSVHGLVYLFGTSVFVVLFVLERTGGVVSKMLGLFCCKLKR